MRTIYSRKGVYLSLFVCAILAAALSSRPASAHLNAHHEPRQLTADQYKGCKFQVTLPSAASSLNLVSGEFVAEACILNGPVSCAVQECLFEYGWAYDPLNLGSSPYTYSRGYLADTIQYSANLSWGGTYVFRATLSSSGVATLQVCDQYETTCSTVRSFTVNFTTAQATVQGEFYTGGGRDDPDLGWCRTVSAINLWSGTAWNGWTIFTNYSTASNSANYTIGSAGTSFSWGYVGRC